MRTLSKSLSFFSIAALAISTLAGCVSSGPTGTEVTRFHLEEPIAAQPVFIKAGSSVDPESIEFNSYAAAVAEQLQANGFSISEDPETDMVAVVDFTRGTREVAPKRSPVSIGIGGGSYGGGGGMSAGASVPVGGASGGQVHVTELGVRLRSQARKVNVWEGQAERTTEEAPASPTALVQSLAAALFKDFPGKSGSTVTVD